MRPWPSYAKKILAITIIFGASYGSFRCLYRNIGFAKDIPFAYSFSDLAQLTGLLFSPASVGAFMEHVETEFPDDGPGYAKLFCVSRQDLSKHLESLTLESLLRPSATHQIKLEVDTYQEKLRALSFAVPTVKREIASLQERLQDAHNEYHPLDSPIYTPAADIAKLFGVSRNEALNIKYADQLVKPTITKLADELDQKLKDLNRTEDELAKMRDSGLDFESKKRRQAVDAIARRVDENRRHLFQRGSRKVW